MSVNAMKQALEALEDVQEAYGNHSKWFKDRVDAIRQAIELAQEPVAWMYDFLDPDNWEEVIRNWVTQDYSDIEREKGFNVRPLYTTPPYRQPLTDEELKKVWYDTKSIVGFYTFQEIVRVVEASHGIRRKE